MRHMHGPFHSAPTIETPRLILRGHSPEDFAEYAAMWGDEVVTRYVGGRPFTREECWARLLRGAGHWPLLGFGYWLAFDKASERLVGEMGLAEFKRDITPSFEGAPEAGWVLASWSHGLGYATEAVGAVHAWGDEHLRAPRTVCIIHPDNDASVRVAGKCGYRQIEPSTYKEQQVLTFERLRR